MTKLYLYQIVILDQDKMGWKNERGRVRIGRGKKKSKHV